MTFENRQAYRAAGIYFGLFIAVQLAAVLFLARFFFRPTWDQHIASGVTAIVATTLVGCAVMSIGEYLFHRYLLHMPMVKPIARMCFSHLAHHKLTSIQFDDASSRVRSEYPIMDVEHDVNSTFPPWALLAFFGLFTPLFAVVAFSFPNVPILIGGYTALAIAHFLYESIHTMHHQPYEEYWAPRLAGPGGSAWRWLYGFHLAHHANYKCNLNVAGFFGVPLGDILFGTYKTPTPLLIDGAAATKAAGRALTPQPRWPISAIDAIALKRRKRMKQL